MNDPTRPLVGTRVVDLTTNMSGPLATMVLADQGADVVKIEPVAGDLIRTIGTSRAGMSAYFANLNRGKRSIAVDLATPAGRDLVLRLCSTADVFVQNFRPGVVERLGLGPDVVRGAHPALVYASISGFGTNGPRAPAPAYDHVVQALSGFAALQSEGGEPAMVRQGAIDKATAYSTAQAITAALLARTRTGEGATIDVAMLDVAIAFLWPDAMMDHTVLEPDKVLPPVSRSFRLTPTADGLVSLVTLTAAQWKGLVAAFADLEGGDADMDDTAARMAGGAEIMRKVRTIIATLPTAEVVERLTAADVPCAPVRGLDEVHLDDQVAANGIVEELDHAVLGAIRQPRPAPVVDGVRPSTTPWAPTAGQHTDEILLGAGWTDAEVARLRADGVVA